MSFGKKKIITKGLLGHYGHSDGWSSKVSSRKMADGRPLLNFIALGFTMKNLC